MIATNAGLMLAALAYVRSPFPGQNIVAPGMVNGLQIP